MAAEIKLSQGAKALNAICGALLLCLAIYLVVSYEGFHVLAYTFPEIPTALSALLPLLSTTGLASAFFLRLRTNITISENGIRYTSRLFTQELRVPEIRGVRIDRSSYFFEPVSTAQKPIRIRDSSIFQSDHELIRFARQFPDLNAIDLKASGDGVRSNPIYGQNQEIRDRRLKRAKSISAYYSFSAVPLMIVLRFMDGSDVVFFCLVYATVGLCLILAGKGLISFYADSRQTQRNPIFIGFAAMSLMGTLKAVTNYGIFNPLILLVPGSVLTILIFQFISRAGLSEGEQRRSQQFTLRWASAVLYSIGFTYFVNCSCDFASGSSYPTHILSKRLSSGYSAGASNYVTVGPWGNRTESREREVKYDLYLGVRAGDRVVVTEKPGLLGASWFYIGKASER